MSHLLDENDELLASPAREMTLGTGSILAIFFGLAVLCALFFGFGYNVGHRSANAALLPTTAAAETPAPEPASTETFSGFKPATKTSPVSPVSDAASAASLAAGPRESATTRVAGQATPARTPAASPAPNTVARVATATNTASRPGLLPRPSVSASSAAHPTPGSSLPASVATPVPGAPGTFFVQVAAVSHPEDASLLLGALRARGYAVTQRNDSADKLIHIQVGPFASKPTAEAMRQRLLADGYNAIIK